MNRIALCLLLLFCAALPLNAKDSQPQFRNITVKPFTLAAPQ